MKERVFKYRIDVYDTDVNIVFTNDIQASYLKHRLATSDDGDYSGCLGICYGGGSQVTVMYRVRKGVMPTHDTLAHEVYHATWAVADRIGAVIHPRKHESWAWVNGYLNNLVYLSLKKAKLTARIFK